MYLVAQGARAFTKRQLSAVRFLGAIAGGLLFGLLSDRLGRRRSMISALILAIAVTPIWAYAPSLGFLVAGAFLMQFMVQGAWGIIPAHLTELSPDSVRGFLPGFAYQCGVLLAGSVVYIEALLKEKMSFAAAMTLTAVTVFLGAIIVSALGREKRGIHFGAGRAHLGVAARTLAPFSARLSRSHSHQAEYHRTQACREGSHRLFLAAEQHLSFCLFFPGHLVALHSLVLGRDDRVTGRD